MTLGDQVLNASRINSITVNVDTRGVLGQSQTQKYEQEEVKDKDVAHRRQIWTQQEHERFIQAVQTYGRNWKAVQRQVHTKTLVQIRSHAQKFFQRMEREGKGDMLPPPRPKKNSKNTVPDSAQVQQQKAQSVIKSNGRNDNNFFYINGRTPVSYVQHPNGYTEGGQPNPIFVSESAAQLFPVVDMNTLCAPILAAVPGQYIFGSATEGQSQRQPQRSPPFNYPSNEWLQQPSPCNTFKIQTHQAQDGERGYAGAATNCSQSFSVPAAANQNPILINPLYLQPFSQFSRSANIAVPNPVPHITREHTSTNAPIANVQYMLDPNSLKGCNFISASQYPIHLLCPTPTNTQYLDQTTCATNRPLQFSQGLNSIHLPWYLPPVSTATSSADPNISVPGILHGYSTVSSSISTTPIPLSMQVPTPIPNQKSNPQVFPKCPQPLNSFPQCITSATSTTPTPTLTYSSISTPTASSILTPNMIPVSCLSASPNIPSASTITSSASINRIVSPEVLNFLGSLFDHEHSTADHGQFLREMSSESQRQVKQYLYSLIKNLSGNPGNVIDSLFSNLAVGMSTNHTQPQDQQYLQRQYTLNHHPEQLAQQLQSKFQHEQQFQHRYSQQPVNVNFPSLQDRESQIQNTLNQQSYSNQIDDAVTPQLRSLLQLQQQYQQVQQVQQQNLQDRSQSDGNHLLKRTQSQSQSSSQPLIQLSSNQHSQQHQQKHQLVQPQDLHELQSRQKKQKYDQQSCVLFQQQQQQSLQQFQTHSQDFKNLQSQLQQMQQSREEEEGEEESEESDEEDDGNMVSLLQQQQQKNQQELDQICEEELEDMDIEDYFINSRNDSGFILDDDNYYVKDM